MSALHFSIGDTLTGTVSAMDHREMVYKLLEVTKKRPLTYSAQVTITSHMSDFERSLFGSGRQTYSTRVTDAELMDKVVRGVCTTSNEAIQKLYNTYRQPPKRITKKNESHTDPDKEYWEYLRSSDSREEKERAADYFDVSPNDFDEPYDSRG